ncbi:30S ribosomal protein S6, partial [Neisseria gonorrhoeae]
KHAVTEASPMLGGEKAKNLLVGAAEEAAAQ